jgi:hypothetical protein
MKNTSAIVFSYGSGCPQLHWLPAALVSFGGIVHGTNHLMPIGGVTNIECTPHALRYLTIFASNSSLLPTSMKSPFVLQGLCETPLPSWDRENSDWLKGLDVELLWVLDSNLSLFLRNINEEYIRYFFQLWQWLPTAAMVASQSCILWGYCSWHKPSHANRRSEEH